MGNWETENVEKINNGTWIEWNAILSEIVYDLQKAAPVQFEVTSMISEVPLHSNYIHFETDHLL